MIAHVLFDQSYEVYGSEEIQQHLFTLSKDILQKNTTPYDRVIALARGGVSIAQTLADFIGVKKISAIQSELYTSIGEKSSTPIIVGPLATSIKEEHVLLVDDLADSGETLLFAKQYLSAHGPKSIETATLAYKPWTACRPDFCAFSSEAWIIFPWETRETIQTLTKMWSGKGITPSHIEQSLASLGYTKDQIETFGKN